MWQNVDFGDPNRIAIGCHRTGNTCQYPRPAVGKYYIHIEANEANSRIGATISENSHWKGWKLKILVLHAVAHSLLQNGVQLCSRSLEAIVDHHIPTALWKVKPLVYTLQILCQTCVTSGRRHLTKRCRALVIIHDSGCSIYEYTGWEYRMNTADTRNNCLFSLLSGEYFQKLSLLFWSLLH